MVARKTVKRRKNTLKRRKNTVKRRNKGGGSRARRVWHLKCGADSRLWSYERWRNHYKENNPNYPIYVYGIEDTKKYTIYVIGFHEAPNSQLDLASTYILRFKDIKRIYDALKKESKGWKKDWEKLEKTNIFGMKEELRQDQCSKRLDQINDFLATVESNANLRYSFGERARKIKGSQDFESWNGLLENIEQRMDDEAAKIKEEHKLSEYMERENEFTKKIKKANLKFFSKYKIGDILRVKYNNRWGREDQIIVTSSVGGHNGRDWDKALTIDEFLAFAKKCGDESEFVYFEREKDDAKAKIVKDYLKQSRKMIETTVNKYIPDQGIIGDKSKKTPEWLTVGSAAYAEISLSKLKKIIIGYAELLYGSISEEVHEDNYKPLEKLREERDRRGEGS